MEIDIYFNKSAQENAEDFFDKSKKLKKKAEGAEKAITELEASLGNLEKETTIRKKIKDSREEGMVRKVQLVLRKRQKPCHRRAQRRSERRDIFQVLRRKRPLLSFRHIRCLGRDT